MVNNLSRLKEDVIKDKLYQKLCREDKDASVILEWKGRKERRLDQDKVHSSRFLAEFDVAVFKRVKDKKLSPILIGYEVKGSKRRGRKYYRPMPHTPIGQSLMHLEEDANQSYMVTIKRENDKQNQALINIAESQKYLGLIFVDAKRNGALRFDEVVTPTKYRRSPNQDRKKCNLHLVSVVPRPWVKDMQWQDWARSAEFSL